MEGKRTALVTGAAQGIGRAVVKRLAACGFSVAVGYYRSEKEAFALAAELQSAGVNALAVRADLKSYAEVESMYEVCRGYFGFVDTVVCCAGISLLKPLYATDPTDYDAAMDSDLRSVYNVCRLFSGDMVSRGFGRIVNVASIWGERGAAVESLYSAAKAGVIGFTKALNAELAPSGVIVNSVSPGMIDTKMNATLSEADKAAFLDRVPLGRIGTPEEVADVIELLTREKLYVAGADIPIDGGLL